MSEPQPSSCAALVVGAGPVGLTMAAHLARHGLACRLIDRAPAPSDKSKALVIWARSLEMLDELGIVGNFEAAGMFINASRLYGGGRLLTRIPQNAAGTHYPRPLVLAQSETERLLTEHLGRVGVAVERPVELTDFREEGDHVLATLGHADGRVEQVRCDWLLGCDGAHSTVRKRLGLEFSGEAEPNDWILADCRVEGPLSPDEMSLFWHHQGVLAFFPFGATRCRVIADLGNARGQGKPPDPSLAEVQATVDERGPGGVRLSEPHWLSGFRINERKVADYRRGRVFLAGDAAHIHSPAGGQGMNTGMQDAWNLAWKLALVHQRKGQPSLLDSYTPERSEVGEMVLRQAGRLTWAATLRNPVAQFLRNRVVWLLGRLPAFRRTFVRNLSELAVHYPHSPLNGESKERGWASSGIRPGDRLPDAPVREAGTGAERRLLTVVRGPQYSLLLLPRDGDAASLVEVRDLGRRVGAAYPGLIQTHLIVRATSAPPEQGEGPTTWLDPRGAVRGLLGARQAALALIRPDGYLGYRGQPPSWEDLQAYLNRYVIVR
jgi:2-polyprenyl-6-methoxyphenol hydroxylase-like FAD-dependent oxidoreductase